MSKKRDSGTPAKIGVEADSRKKENPFTGSLDVLYSSLLNSVGEGVTFLDPELHILYANEATATITGVPVKKQIGKRCYEVRHGLKSPCSQCPVEKVLATGKCYQQEMQDESGKTILIRGYPVQDRNGRIIGVTELATDITEQKKSGEALKESEERFRRIFHASPTGILLADISRRNILDVNESLCRIFGYRPLDVIGKSTLELGVWADPQERESVLRQFEEQGYIRNREISGRDADGNSIPLLLSCEPIEVGGKKCLLAMLYDIRELKKAQDQLRESNERFLKIFNVTPVATSLSDLETNEVLDVNEAFTRITGYTREEILGRRTSDFNLWVNPEIRRALVEKIRKGQAVHYEEADLRVKSGDIRTVSFRGEIIDLRGRPCLLMTGMDVTERTRVQQALRRERDFVSAVLDTAGMLVVVLDREGKITRFNRACETLTGYGFEEVRGRIFWEFLVAPEEMVGIQATWQALTRGDFPNTHENHWLTKNGSRRLISWSNTVLTDATGQVEYVIATGLDVTERREALDALKESELRLQLMTVAGNIGLWDWTLDSGETYYSPECKRQLGYGPEDKFHNIKDWEDRLHPEDRDQTLDILRKYLEHPWPDYSQEFRARHKDGSYRWILTRAMLFRAPAGKNSRMLGCSIDITDRKNAEEALRSQRDFAENLLATANSLIVVLDACGNIRMFNQFARKLTGYEEQEVLGVNYFDLLIQPEFRERLKNKFAEILAGAQYQRGENPVLCKNGRLITVEWRFSRLTDSSGAVTGLLAIGLDVTAVRQQEQQLRQAQKMEAVGRLAGGIAHDFNNQLTVVKGYCDLLLSQMPPDSPDASAIQEILGAANRAAKLTSQLLSFSRKQFLRPQVINPNDVLRRMLDMLQRMCGDNIRVQYHVDEAICNVRIDTAQLEQAILNLVANARDAMPHGGDLFLRTVNEDVAAPRESVHNIIPTGQYVVISVADTGTGLSEEAHRHIFEPFFTTKPVGQGTGLGLPMVYGFVRQSGGYIRVDSQSDQGCTFSIYLPVIAEIPGKESAQPLRSQPARGHETILVVEDSESVRQLAIGVLAERGFAVLGAHDPREALTIAESFDGKIDLLLTDIIMPDMRGEDLADEFVRYRPNAKVLFISGFRETQVGENHGPHPMLSKPFGPEELAQAVRQALDASPVK